ncbi:NAD-dependent epimerase/dehydratase family protein [Flavihumibacter profundi]|uniref:NAD-dependent epimerase/dehydratase family protein n=1 Tax=Flavihumibacter profundi TaxID=2716883 RepID=UPI001CC42B4E|nr:NAD-dependent epimerase/dehydratase family protein [Flavihumibacter profundi]MBZ5858257.1 NAD-dependent epimerase/dehydratase family protein [Flavihumibacter profundi]
MNSIQQVYQDLLEPSDALVADIKKLDGDIIILGAGGKMGPALAKLARKAIDKAGIPKKVTAVSRFSEPGLQNELELAGIETCSADLLDDGQLQQLPDAKNILYLAGQKFGTTGKEAYTWAMNVYLPGRVAEKYRHSRIVVFSTGNVYPLSAVSLGGLAEDHPPGPLGEYAQSCLGRERLFQYAAAKYATPLFIYRLNYAVDLSYGVLLEIAKSVNEGRPVDLGMGHVNVIWQGDANEIALRALLHCAVPPKIVNITGPETVSVRWAAQEFGKLFGKTPQFINEEKPTALLSNAAESFRLFGYPRVTLKQMIGLLAEWVNQGGKTINKPTHFQEREGQF